MAKARRMKEKARKIKITIKRNGKLKSTIQILSILVVIIIGIFLIQNTVGDSSIEQNIKTMEKERTFENLTIKNTYMKYEEGESIFKFELANESDTDFQERDVKVIFQNRDKTKYEEIEYHIDTIKSHESFYINTSINRDLTQAKDFYIENK